MYNSSFNCVHTNMNRLDYIRYVKTREVARVLGISYMVLYNRLKRKRGYSYKGMMSVKDLELVMEKPSFKPRQMDKSLYNKVDNKVSEYYDVSLNDIYSKSKQAIHVEPRHLIWYILHEVHKINKHRIAKQYNRCWMTVNEGVLKIEDYRSCYKEYDEILDKLS